MYSFHILIGFDIVVPTYYNTHFLEEPIKFDLCDPSPCGPNARCNNGTCSCLPEYQGDPYRECRPECILNNDCPRDKHCVRNKCVEPCPGSCAINAKCEVFNHISMCSCPLGFTGNAFILCSEIKGIYKIFFSSPFISNLNILAPVVINPCSPNPCGPNSQCRTNNGQAVCSCLDGYMSSPPTCRPECISSSECSLDQACLNQKCINPCPGTCGLRANCQVVNHNPICSCPNSYTGDPFVRCTLIGMSPKNLD